MSEAENIKKAVQDAKKSLEEEKDKQLKERVRSIVKQLLETIDSREKEIRSTQEELSILKKDLKDLEAGRLDLIEERQKNNEVAKRISVIRIKRLNFDDKPWYSPYTISSPSWLEVDTMMNEPWKYAPTTYSSCCSSVSASDSSILMTTGNDFSEMAVGTYMLDSGKSIDIRPFSN
jgi:hypothetical protein